GIGQALTMPLFFTSNALYPIAIMPWIMQCIAHFNPMSYIVDAVRSLMITGDLTSLPIDLAAILAFDTVMFIIASASFKRIIE
ncbi:MAG: ABC transporter permease, partial [Candidatus Bathyarchaeia archaeon]